MKKRHKTLIICLILGLVGYLWFQSWSYDVRALFYSTYDSSFHEPIFSGFLDLSKKGKRIRVPLTPKYDGRYSLDVVMPESIPLNILKKQTGLLRVTLYCHNSDRLSFCNSDLYETIGKSDGETRLGLFNFYITKDLLLCPDLELEIEVIKPYTYLNTAPKAQLLIRSTYLL